MIAKLKNGKTQTIAILGWPLDYTLSPTFQNAGLIARDLNATYVALPVKDTPAFLSLAQALMGSPNFVGANITNPHKSAALSLATPTPQAKKIGAANLLYRQGRVWRAHNTDGDGFLLALKREHGLSPRGHKVTVLGAGGAAAALVWALTSTGAHVRILARRLAQADSLARSFSSIGKVGAGEIEFSRLNKEFSTQDWVINTVPDSKFSRQAGGALGPVPEGAKRLAIDISYVPVLTPFLAAGASEGWTIMNGLPMLLAQGELSFGAWFKGKVPSREMAAALLSQG